MAKKLSARGLEKILSTTENLIKIKGQWVEVDRDQLQQVLTHWKKIQRQVTNEGLTFAEGLRLLAGTSTNNAKGDSDAAVSITEWSSIKPGDWLQEVLTSLRNPEQVASKEVMSILKKYLFAILRPYQLAGVQWLWLLYNLKLGGCLADDMGLGKTMQLLALLLLVKYHSSQTQKYPHLLVLPASLLGNWQTEIERFAPDLKILIAHASANNGDNLKKISFEQLAKYDLGHHNLCFCSPFSLDSRNAMGCVGAR